jgi:hypothetical protein
MTDAPPRHRALPLPGVQRGATGRLLLIVLAIVAALAAVEFYAIFHNGRARVAQAAPATAAARIIGFVDMPAQDIVAGDTLRIEGWASAQRGIREVDVDIDGKPHTARYGLARDDVAAAHVGFADARLSGFRFDADLSALPAQRHEATVVAIDKDGERAVLGRRSFVSPQALARWKALADANPGFAQRPFWFLMATSGVARGGAAGIETQYRALESATMRVGMAVPILYMRTTKGLAGDFAFDPEFDLSRKCGARPVADDNLRGVVDYAVAHRLPVNFILNGGIWGDASCDSRDWDLTDHLQLDPANCQWDDRNVVLPDDFKKGLNGSTESPLLSRSLTYHVYATQVRAYKRRNLTAAARIVAQFAREHPDLFVGVNLDADTYMNPFVREGRRFDYNPGMLRQFREWLAGTGPYAGQPTDGAPDLAYYRRKRPLTLGDVNRIAGKHWQTWSEVDPPRYFPGDDGQPVKVGETPFWQDPWYQEWDVFRKHIVQLHYAELAQWTHDAGVPADRIFTAQAFTAHDPGMRPLSTYVAGESPDYDSAGVSVEGAVPRIGHLGAILYGPSAENKVTMETDHNLFATIARLDPQWAIVESNATDLKKVDVLPVYAQSYHAFRDFFNYGGRQISLMAWNGANGANAGKPGYVAYTSWRNTPAEQAMMDFLVSHAGLPHGALLWTFGSPRLSSADEWIATHGLVTAEAGALAMHPSGDRLTLRSPPDLVIRPASLDRLALRFDGSAQVHHAVIYAKADGDDRWQVIARAQGPDIALEWPATWRARDAIVERLELELAFAPGADGSHLTDVLLYPSSPANRAARER